MASLVASGTGSAFGTLRTGIVSLYSPPGGRRGHLFLRSTATISLSTVVSSLVWHTARHLGIVLVASPSTSGIGAIELAIVNAAGWFIAFVLLIEYYAAAWPRTFSWRVPSSNTHRGKPLHYRHLKQKHDNRISNALQSSTGVVPGASQSGPVSSALWFGSNGLASEASVRYPPSPPSGASTVRGGMRRKSSTASSNGDVFTPPPPSLPAVNVVADQSADLARPPRSSLSPIILHCQLLSHDLNKADRDNRSTPALNTRVGCSTAIPSSGSNSSNSNTATITSQCTCSR
ncbi:hypothetical protein BC828DRAFT_180166 [Blastocladiella britannica]|nr:hypothetical protein BC828DRAFT_180166 [Blastocladiella britannica]